MSDALTDAGLLSPVRAGTPAEAAVCDLAWLQGMLDAEAALARAQARLGTLPVSAADTITRVARAQRLDLRAIAVGARETANPVVGLVRAFTEVVAAEGPAAAEYVHRGSTSQDVFDTGAMLVARDALRLIRADLDTAAHALARLAAEHRDTAMAGRTLALHPVPPPSGSKRRAGASCCCRRPTASAPSRTHRGRTDRGPAGPPRADGRKPGADRLPHRLRTRRGRTGPTPRQGGGQTTARPATAEAERTELPLAKVLADPPEVTLDAPELAALCDPAHYTGAAGPLVDRALRPRG